MDVKWIHMLIIIELILIKDSMSDQDSSSSNYPRISAFFMNCNVGQKECWGVKKANKTSHGVPKFKEWGLTFNPKEAGDFMSLELVNDVPMNEQLEFVSYKSSLDHFWLSSIGLHEFNYNRMHNHVQKGSHVQENWIWFDPYKLECIKVDGEHIADTISKYSIKDPICKFDDNTSMNLYIEEDFLMSMVGWETVDGPDNKPFKFIRDDTYVQIKKVKNPVYHFKHVIKQCDAEKSVKCIHCEKNSLLLLRLNSQSEDRTDFYIHTYTIGESRSLIKTDIGFNGTVGSERYAVNCKHLAESININGSAFESKETPEVRVVGEEESHSEVKLKVFYNYSRPYYNHVRCNGTINFKLTPKDIESIKLISDGHVLKREKIVPKAKTEKPKLESDSYIIWILLCFFIFMILFGVGIYYLTQQKFFNDIKGHCFESAAKENIAENESANANTNVDTSPSEANPVKVDSKFGINPDNQEIQPVVGSKTDVTNTNVKTSSGSKLIPTEANPVKVSSKSGLGQPGNKVKSSEVQPVLENRKDVPNIIVDPKVVLKTSQPNLKIIKA